MSRCSIAGEKRPTDKSAAFCSSSLQLTLKITNVPPDGLMPHSKCAIAKHKAQPGQAVEQAQLFSASEIFTRRPRARAAFYNASATQTFGGSHVASHPRKVPRFIFEAGLRQPGDVNARWKAASHTGLDRLRRRTRHLQFRQGPPEGPQCAPRSARIAGPDRSRKPISLS